MLGVRRGHVQHPDVELVAGVDLDDPAGTSDELRGPARHDHLWLPAEERERGPVQMIHVSVRDQDAVEIVHGVELDRIAPMEMRDAHPQHGVGDDPRPVHGDQNRGMPDVRETHGPQPTDPDACGRYPAFGNDPCS